MLVKTNLTIGVLVFAALLRGESYVSPAQGPPVASPTNANTILVREYITDPLKNSLDQKLAQINATLAARTDARAKVRLLNVKVYSPLLLPTQFTDRPNQRFVWVQYMLKFEIYDIQYDGRLCNPGPLQNCLPGQIVWSNYPFTRKVSMAVDVRTFCDGWENGEGKIKIVADPNPPALESISYAEAAVNFFLGGTLVPLVNAQISNVLTQPGPVSQTLPGTRCVSLGSSYGDPNTYDDDLILWNLPGSRPAPFSLPITVRVVSVKRLSAHRPDGQILYDTIESPTLDFWAGFGRGNYQLPPLAEGQEVLLAEPPIQVFPQPNGAHLVVLANIWLPNKLDGDFTLLPRTERYGNGIRKLTISKTYWTPPAPPLNKPTKFIVPAYEVTFDVNAPVLPPVVVPF